MARHTDVGQRPFIRSGAISSTCLLTSAEHFVKSRRNTELKHLIKFSLSKDFWGHLAYPQLDQKISDILAQVSNLIGHWEAKQHVAERPKFAPKALGSGHLSLHFECGPRIK